LTGIERFLLRAKHWQIFVLFISTQIAGFVGLIATELTVKSSENPLVSAVIEDAFTLPSFLCYLAWWWSTGSLLHSLIKPARELNIRLFRFSCIFILLSSLSTNLLSPIYGPFKPIYFAGIAALSFCVLLLVLYIPYFLSKSLVTKTKGRVELGGGDVAFFFLFLFPFIGVWLIQPRINQLYAETQKWETKS
jgi:hypothetical protein